MKIKTVIVLGSASYCVDYGNYLKKTNSQAMLLIVGKSKISENKTIKNATYLQLKKTKNNLGEITAYCEINNLEVIAVLNRLDSLELLHGALCDHYQVVGPSRKAIKKLANKALMHEQMVVCDLSFYRPQTIITLLENAQNYLGEIQFPVIMKASLGAKSRGVITLTNRKDFFYFMDLFVTEGVFKKGSKVLFEQMIYGKQVSPVMYVNSRGKVVILSLVDVVTAREVKQNHMQLIYRTTPSRHPESIRQKISYVMQKLVSKAKLKSVMLHPEFFVVGKNIYLIEVNVRIGGFRYTLMKEAYNIDLNKISWDLAFNDLQIADNIDNDMSCTACEVWEENSGVISKISIPRSSNYKSFFQGKFVGDVYRAPPEQNKPIANFYVTSKEDSLKIAKDVRKKITVEFE